MKIDIMETKLTPKKRVELVKNEGEALTLDDGVQFNTVDGMEELAKAIYDGRDYAEEHLWAVGLTAKCKPIAAFHVCSGTATACVFPTREILMRMFLCGAFKFKQDIGFSGVLFSFV